jgi:hypothetical protein
LIVGVSASYSGGAISDYFSETHPEVKGLVGGIGALTAYPFLVLSFAISHNFWLSMFSFSVSYFPGEMWLGASYTIIQNIFPAEIVGTGVAVFNF